MRPCDRRSTFSNHAPWSQVDQQEASLKPRFTGLNFSIIFTVLIFLTLSILTGLGIFIHGSSPSAVFILPAILLLGTLTLIWFVRLKNLEKVVFPIAVVLALTFSSLSGDVLPFVNRYPMKKFAEHINQENIIKCYLKVRKELKKYLN